MYCGKWSGSCSLCPFCGYSCPLDEEESRRKTHKRKRAKGKSKSSRGDIEPFSVEIEGYN